MSLEVRQVKALVHASSPTVFRHLWLRAIQRTCGQLWADDPPININVVIRGRSALLDKIGTPTPSCATPKEDHRYKRNAIIRYPTRFRVVPENSDASIISTRT